MSYASDLLDSGYFGSKGYSITYLTSQKNSWISLPNSLASQLSQRTDVYSYPVAIRLTSAQPNHATDSRNPIYLSWAGAISDDNNSIGVPAAVARYLRLDPGSLVTVTPLPPSHAPPATTISVEPASPDDWEVVELNSTRIESELLSQTAIASTDQLLVVWVYGQAIPLTVSTTTPAANVVRLVDGSEIIVAPRPRFSYNNNANMNNKADGSKNSKDGAVHKSGQEECQQKPGICTAVRLLPPLPWIVPTDGVDDLFDNDDDDNDDDDNDDGAPSNDIDTSANENNIGERMENDITKKLPRGVHKAYTSRVGCPLLHPGDWASVSTARGGSITVCIASHPLSEIHIPPGHILVSDVARDSMGAEYYEPLQLVTLDSSEKNKIVEQAQSQTGQLAQDKLKTSSYSSPYMTMHDRKMVEKHSYFANIADDCTNQLSTVISSSQHGAVLSILQAILPIIASPARSILYAWDAPRPGSVLLSGPPGSGKKSLLKALAHTLQRHPYTLADFYTVRCREISSEEDAEKRISSAVADAISHMPAIILLEDIDVLCPHLGNQTDSGIGPPPKEGGASGGAASHGGAVVNWLCEILDGVTNPGEHWIRSNQQQRKGAWNGIDHVGASYWPAVAVIATCRDAAGVSPALREVGRFETVVNIEPLSITSRTEILMSSIAAAQGGMPDGDGTGHVLVNRSDVEDIARRADGFDGSDLVTLVQRAFAHATSRYLITSSTTAHNRGNTTNGSSRPSKTIAPTCNTISLVKSDLELAMQGMVASAFWGSGTRTVVQSGVQGWEDVGGMRDVQDALREALELPLKHAALVALAPLRLRTGALLYGPPGCGKTHIVAAAVAATGVRCITVSGPELLNKYIGASEAGVRDVFKRAAAAAPSVLFFDEFDAIAPQRGHDNTGVTDRVVNQLLTELDGVEGLKGVSVIAATSRPDLIDSALLRPGRLDRLLYCRFPDEDDRKSILEALSRRLPMDDDVDLDSIARQAEGFSGADLGAVLADAQLAAAHDVLEERQHQHSTTLETITVAQHHLQAALQSARPSVSGAERRRLEAIYDRFHRGGEMDGAFEAAQQSRAALMNNIGKKVSWA